MNAAINTTLRDHIREASMVQAPSWISPSGIPESECFWSQGGDLPCTERTGGSGQ